MMNTYFNSLIDVNTIDSLLSSDKGLALSYPKISKNFTLDDIKKSELQEMLRNAKIKLEGLRTKRHANLKLKNSSMIEKLYLQCKNSLASLQSIRNELRSLELQKWSVEDRKLDLEFNKKIIDLQKKNDINTKKLHQIADAIIGYRKQIDDLELQLKNNSELLTDIESGIFNYISDISALQSYVGRWGAARNTEIISSDHHYGIQAISKYWAKDDFAEAAEDLTADVAASRCGKFFGELNQMMSCQSLRNTILGQKSALAQINRELERSRLQQTAIEEEREVFNIRSEQLNINLLSIESRRDNFAVSFAARALQLSFDFSNHCEVLQERTAMLADALDFVGIKFEEFDSNRFNIDGELSYLRQFNDNFRRLGLSLDDFYAMRSNIEVDFISDIFVVNDEIHRVEFSIDLNERYLYPDIEEVYIFASGYRECNVSIEYDFNVFVTNKFGLEPRVEKRRNVIAYSCRLNSKSCEKPIITGSPLSNIPGKMVFRVDLLSKDPPTEECVLRLVISGSSASTPKLDDILKY